MECSGADGSSYRGGRRRRRGLKWGFRRRGEEGGGQDKEEDMEEEGMEEEGMEEREGGERRSDAGDS